MKILIAEDDKTLSDTLCVDLRRVGYDVVPVLMGDQVIPRINDEKPNLILLDILMPNMNGFTILEELKQKSKNPTPVIILTNLDKQSDVEKGMSLGAADYIIKSNISLSALEVKISKILNRPNESTT